MPPGVYPHKSQPVADRFWRSVQLSEVCWTWTASTTEKDRRGYGQISVNGKMQRAHVIAWELAGGKSPARGEAICHTCDNMGCVRNDDLGMYEVRGVLYERRGHLWLATKAANSADMADKGRMRQQIDPTIVPRGDRHKSVTHPESVPRGERNGCAKLTESDVRSIRARYRSPGVTVVALAAEFGVWETTIRRVAKRRAWQHID